MSANARFLAALADELARGRQMAEALAPLLSAASLADTPDALVRAQGLDLLVQHLDALSALAGRVAHGDDPQEAAAAAPLGDLARRMGAALAGEAAISSDQPSGDLILFD